MAELMHGLVGVTAQKWKEIATSHPSWSPSGMLDLAEVFCETPLLFVRTIRHPLEIVRSFYALREDRGDNVGTAHLANDEMILHMIRSESTTSEFQIEALRTKEPWCKYMGSVVEVRYEEFGDIPNRGRLVKRICECLPHREENSALLFSAIENTFGVAAKSARVGRLTTGQPGTISKTKLEWWKKNLNDVAEREGYEL